MYNSLRILLLLLAVATAYAPATAQTVCLGQSPAQHTKELALMAQAMTPQTRSLPVPDPAELLRGAFDVEKRKFIDKTMKVGKADMLNIENKFGKVHINTWDKNEVHIRVDIIARANSENGAQEILDNIKVIQRHEENVVSFRTSIEPMRISGKNTRSYEVNYTISMPEANPLTVKNSFGDVYVATLTGTADLSVKYGSLKSDRLGSTGNVIKLAYGSGSCAYINGGKLDVSYGDMNVGSINSLQGSSSFSEFKIGGLGESMQMDLKYGSLKVDNISRSMRTISLGSGFTPISLNFEPNSAFNFDVQVQFADFNYDKSNVKITSLEKGHTSASYKGIYSGASPKGTVSIDSKYGEVKFTK